MELQLNPNASPVTRAVCSSPQATCSTQSFFTQNLFGKLSANLLLPNVKTAPLSENEMTSNYNYVPVQVPVHASAYICVCMHVYVCVCVCVCVINVHSI